MNDFKSITEITVNENGMRIPVYADGVVPNIIDDDLITTEWIKERFENYSDYDDGCVFIPIGDESTGDSLEWWHVEPCENQPSIGPELCFHAHVLNIKTKTKMLEFMEFFKNESYNQRT